MGSLSVARPDHTTRSSAWTVRYLMSSLDCTKPSNPMKGNVSAEAAQPRQQIQMDAGNDQSPQADRRPSDANQPVQLSGVGWIPPLHVRHLASSLVAGVSRFCGLSNEFSFWIDMKPTLRVCHETQHLMPSAQKERSTLSPVNYAHSDVGIAFRMQFEETIYRQLCACLAR